MGRSFALGFGENAGAVEKLGRGSTPWTEEIGSAYLKVLGVVRFSSSCSFIFRAFTN